MGLNIMSGVDVKSHEGTKCWGKVVFSHFHQISIALAWLGWRPYNYTIHIYTHTYIHTYMYVYMYIHIHVCIYMNMCSACMCIYIMLYAYPLSHTQTDTYLEKAPFLTSLGDLLCNALFTVISIFSFMSSSISITEIIDGR